MHSRKLKEFSDEIKYKNRNPRNIELLKQIDNIEDNPTFIIQPETILYRSRKVETDLNTIDSEPGFHGYNSLGSFVAPPLKTKDMRANYRFIPYLYVASSKRLSVKEIRPEEGDSISVASIIVDEDLTVFDLRQIKNISANRNVKDSFLIDLAELYSKPVDTSEDQIEYIPTQFIAEYIKQLDYDGIIYPSSLGDDKNIDYNIVVFNYDKCHAISSEIVGIMGGEICQSS